jgi:hypothetical protein
MLTTIVIANLSEILVAALLYHATPPIAPTALSLLCDGISDVLIFL